MSEMIKADVMVLGAGVGGYTAAFRAADLGKNVVLIERHATLGGVCLNVGCIPSKALLHAVQVMEEAEDMSKYGISFSDPQIDVEKLASWKAGVVKRLTGGLKMLAKQRKVNVVHGQAEFVDDHHIKVETEAGEVVVEFDHAVVAAGSLPVKLPFIPEDPRIIDSTAALELKETGGEMLILGGGIIGLEMATVYHALGTKITVVEMMDQIIPGTDKDVIEPLFRRIKRRYNFMLKTKVTKVEAKEDGLWVSFEGSKAPIEPVRFDRILVAVGRKPNGFLIGADKAGIAVNEQGFIPVDQKMRTNCNHVFAIGDIIGQPMLAHKAAYEGRLAAEVISGIDREFSAKCIPSIAYTDPEIAWVGLTEIEAKENKIDYGVGVFPWAACGRALSLNRPEGFTKVIVDNKTHKIIGAAVTGVHGGDLIAELALAIQNGLTVDDVASTIHAHPTLGETVMMAAEVFEGTATDIFAPKK